MRNYHNQTSSSINPLPPSPRELSVVFLAFILSATPLGTPHCLAAPTETKNDETTLFYASFDESLDANDAKGDPAPKKGNPSVTGDGGGKHGEALDLTPLEYPFGYTTLGYDFMDNLSPEEGTVEFWYKPEFNRTPTSDNPFISYYLFDIPTHLRDANNQVVRVAISVSENAGVRKVWIASGMTEEEGTPLTGAVVDWVPGEWHHVAMTWNSEEILLYLDGIPVASIYAKGGLFGGNEESLAAIAGELCVGGAWQHSAGVSAGGYIDELKISNKAFGAEYFKSKD